MIVRHEKKETLTVQLDAPDGLGPIQIIPTPNGGIMFCMKGGWLYAKPSDEGGHPDFGYGPDEVLVKE